MQEVEDQATAGLDLAMADALVSLGQSTSLQETQVRCTAARQARHW